MGDALLDAIIATPDDDAPRLVWADREGGARGELVVVQCRLEDHSMPRAERRRLVRRERELVGQLTKEWTGPGIPKFERGFVTGASVSIHDLPERAAELVEKAPLLRDLDIQNMFGTSDRFDGPAIDEVWAGLLAMLEASLAAFPPDRIRSYSSEATVSESAGWSGPPGAIGFADTLARWIGRHPNLKKLRSVAIANGDGTPAIADALLPLANLEYLGLPNHRLPSGGATAIVRGLPRLRGLALDAGRPSLNEELAELIPAAKNLTSLSLRGHIFEDHEVGMLSELVELERLFLGMGTHRPGPGLRKLLDRLDRLTDLTLVTIAKPEELEPLLHAACAPRLRRLALWLTQHTSQSARVYLDLPSLEELEIKPSLVNFGSAKELDAALPSFRLVERK